jgi:hypothetical protein
MMTHLTLERHQVWIYLVAIIFGLGLVLRQNWPFLLMASFRTGKGHRL